MNFYTSAKVVVELSKFELIQAAVLLHPSLVTVDDIKGLNISSIFFSNFDLFLYLSFLIKKIPFWKMKVKEGYFRCTESDRKELKLQTNNKHQKNLQTQTKPYKNLIFC